MTQRTLVLDTNIISETLKQEADKGVIAWLIQNQEDLYLTAITIGELLQRAHRLPAGKRRENLLIAIERIVNGYDGRILAYDGLAARVYAEMQDISYRSGRVLTVEDGMIAAICSSANAVLATHNTKDFLHLDVVLVDPFVEPTPDVVEVNLG